MVAWDNTQNCISIQLLCRFNPIIKDGEKIYDKFQYNSCVGLICPAKAKDLLTKTFQYNSCVGLMYP